MTSYILSFSCHSHDWQTDPGISIWAQPLWCHKVILQKFGRKHELLACLFSNLRDTVPRLQSQPVHRFPTHWYIEPKMTILLPLVVASCASNGWRSHSQKNMKFQQKRSQSTRFCAVVGHSFTKLFLLLFISALPVSDDLLTVLRQPVSLTGGFTTAAAEGAREGNLTQN